MADPMSWLSDTFSSMAEEDDLVKARSLNITRITGVVTPVLAGIWTAISELSDTKPFNQTGFQRQLILALIGLIAVVSVADILGRSIASAKTAPSVAVATPLPSSLKASKDVPGAPDIAGRVVAFRASNASEPASSGEYLFVADDRTVDPSWERADVMTLTPTQ